MGGAGRQTGVCPENIPMFLLGLSQICGYEGEWRSKTQTSLKWEEGEASPAPDCVNFV